MLRHDVRYGSGDIQDVQRVADIDLRSLLVRDVDDLIDECQFSYSSAAIFEITHIMCLLGHLTLKLRRGRRNFVPRR